MEGAAEGGSGNGADAIPPVSVEVPSCSGAGEISQAPGSSHEPDLFSELFDDASVDILNQTLDSFDAFQSNPPVRSESEAAFIAACQNFQDVLAQQYRLLDQMLPKLSALLQALENQRATCSDTRKAACDVRSSLGLFSNGHGSVTGQKSLLSAAAQAHGPLSTYFVKNVATKSSSLSSEAEFFRLGVEHLSAQGYNQLTQCNEQIGKSKFLILRCQPLRASSLKMLKEFQKYLVSP